MTKFEELKKAQSLLERRKGNKYPSERLEVFAAQYVRDPHPLVVEVNPVPDQKTSNKKNGYPGSGYKAGKGLAVYKLLISKNITNNKEHAKKDSEKKNLAKLPTEILALIFDELDSSWQVCLALASKRLAEVSRLANNNKGVIYRSGARLQILWRLESWMTKELRMCLSCEKYFPVAPRFWAERKLSGRCKAQSEIYGRSLENFYFTGEKCPECVADVVWERIQRNRLNLEMPMVDWEMPKANCSL